MDVVERASEHRGSPVLHRAAATCLKRNTGLGPGRGQWPLDNSSLPNLKPRHTKLAPRPCHNGSYLLWSKTMRFPISFTIKSESDHHHDGRGTHCPMGQIRQRHDWSGTRRTVTGSLQVEQAHGPPGPDTGRWRRSRYCGKLESCTSTSRRPARRRHRASDGAESFKFKFPI